MSSHLHLYPALTTFSYDSSNRHFTSPDAINITRLTTKSHDAGTERRVGQQMSTTAVHLLDTGPDRLQPSSVTVIVSTQEHNEGSRVGKDQT